MEAKVTEYKLDKVLIDRVKDPIHKVWNYIGGDAAELCDNNKDCMEMCLDANRLSMCAEDKEAEDIVHSVIVKFGYKKVFNFLCKNIQVW